MAIKKPTVKRAIQKTPPKKKTPQKKRTDGKLPRVMKSKIDGMKIITRPIKRKKRVSM